MKYKADLGEDYDSGGRVVEIDASCREEALTKAIAMLQGDEIVLQIFVGNRKCIYDFMNGFSIYEEVYK